MLTAKSTTASASLDIGDPGEQGILFDYLSAEVFDKLPKSLRSFLLRTSILREFTAAMCDELLDLSSSEQLIDQIKDRSLFLEERAGRNPTYAHHDLVKDYLERRFRLEIHGEHQQISRRAADLYREVGDDDFAIYH